MSLPPLQTEWPQTEWPQTEWPQTGAHKNSVDFGTLPVPELVERYPLFSPAGRQPQYLEQTGLEQDFAL